MLKSRKYKMDYNELGSSTILYRQRKAQKTHKPVVGLFPTMRQIFSLESYI